MFSLNLWLYGSSISVPYLVSILIWVFLVLNLNQCRILIFYALEDMKLCMKKFEGIAFQVRSKSLRTFCSIYHFITSQCFKSGFCDSNEHTKCGRH